MFFDCGPAIGFDNAQELLRFARSSDWNNQTPSCFQLGYQRIRDARAAGRYQNPVIGPISVPAQRSVKSFNRSVINSQFINALLSESCQFTNTFNRVNL